MKTKVISLILAALMILTALLTVSCGETEQPETTTASASTTAAETEETTAGETEPPFPEATYNCDFTVYMRAQNSAHYAGMYIVPLEDSADVIDQEAVKRNLMVEEKYNVKIKSIEVESPFTTVRNDVSGGTVSYQLVLDKRNSMNSLAIQGCFYNFNKLNIDFSKSWWDANAAEAYTIDGKLFAMPNDISVSNLAGCRFYYFNKEVLENFNLKSPYEYAEENNWTIDSFFTLVKSVSSPSTDGTIGVYGLVNEEGSVRNHMTTGIGGIKCEVSADGSIVCNLGTTYADRVQDFYEKLKAVVTDASVCLSFDDVETMDSANASAYSDKYNHARGAFAAGHFLFTQSSMGCAYQFADMEKGFGVIMNPKYNQDQESYYHQMDNNAIIWTIPNDANQDFEMIANVTDYWAYCSSKTVMESYYEVNLKAKRASDPTTPAMLDIIKSTICYYPTDIYTGADISGFLTAAYNTSVASAWKKYSKSLSKKLAEIETNLASLSD